MRIFVKLFFLIWIRGPRNFYRLWNSFDLIRYREIQIYFYNVILKDALCNSFKMRRCLIILVRHSQINKTRLYFSQLVARLLHLCLIWGRGDCRNCYTTRCFHILLRFGHNFSQLFDYILFAYINHKNEQSVWWVDYIRQIPDPAVLVYFQGDDFEHPNNTHHDEQLGVCKESNKKTKNN